ncbi:MAG: hypothetical protein H8D67_28410 [Deltaproteobacteria bacterium]|nr:hypothetical protein [Deltaproteobacteria bacterium]MBL7205338.1 hypothetical protein [Desulfobacteraceae bacterium]
MIVITRSSQNSIPKPSPYALLFETNDQDGKICSQISKKELICVGIFDKGKDYTVTLNGEPMAQTWLPCPIA